MAAGGPQDLEEHVGDEVGHVLGRAEAAHPNARDLRDVAAIELGQEARTGGDRRQQLLIAVLVHDTSRDDGLLSSRGCRPRGGRYSRPEDPL